MATRRLSSRTVALVLAGVAGVVLAHGLDYVLVVRSSAARASTLAETGHGWWPSALGAALGAAFLAAGMATARGAAGAAFRRAAGGATTTMLRDLGRVVLWQAGLFTAVEVVERLAAHRSPLDLLHGPLFPVGLLLQFAAAALVVAALRRLERAGEQITVMAMAGREQRRRARRPTFPCPPRPIGRSFGPFGRHEARGPPLSVVR